MSTLLIVEDNEMNRDMLSRRLIRKGYAIIMAEDGEQGIERARQDAPDLILMDMSLPVMTGWEAARMLKSDPVTARIPLIALTAHAMTSDKEQALNAGCDDFETKPIEFPQLLAKIDGLLQSSASTAAL